MRRWLRGLIATVAVALTGACESTSIFRHSELSPSSPSVTMVDAKQRAIIANTFPVEQADGKPAQDLRICAEPSPDVFAVLAQSFGANGSAEQSPESLKLLASLAWSQAEQGSTITRTQTVNLLREMMYRTCERYLNNSLNPLELPIQAVRDQRLMISTLAIEQLTGTVMPAPVIIGASSSSSAGSSGADAIVRIDDAHKAYRDAEANFVARSSAMSALDDTDPKCSTVRESSEAANAEKKAACLAAEKALSDARTRRDDTRAHYETLSKPGLSPAVLARSDVSTPANKSGTAAATEPAESDRKAIASTVLAIVNATFAQDEFQLFCMKILYEASTGKQFDDDGKIRDACVAYTSSTINVKAAQFEAELAELTLASSDYFEKFWARVSKNGAVDSEKLTPILNAFRAERPSYPFPQNLTELAKARDRAEAEAAFKKFSIGDRKYLAGAQQ